MEDDFVAGFGDNTSGSESLHRHVQENVQGSHRPLFRALFFLALS